MKPSLPMKTFTMTRHRLLACSIVTLSLGGFAACTFGANDFEIVDANSIGGSGGDGSAGSSAGGMGQGGDGAGGGTGGNGTGGSGAASKCTPDAAPFTVFSVADLQGHALQNEPIRVVSTGPDTAVVAVHVSAGGSGAPNASTVWLRGISDSGGGDVKNIVPLSEMPTEHVHVGAVEYRPNDGLHVVVGGSQLEDHVFTDTGNGDLQLKVTNTLPPLPPDCNPTTGFGIRDLRVSLDGPLSYVVTCDLGNAMSLWLGDGMSPQPYQIGVTGPDKNNVVRQYVKIEDTHVIIVGDDGPSPAPGLRVGQSMVELTDVKSLALSTDPNVFTYFGLKGMPDGSGMAVFGAAFTAGSQMPWPIVPADLYGGFLAKMDLGSLTQVPPPSLTKIRSLDATMTGDMFSINGMTMLGDIIYKMGVSFSPHDRIGLTLFKKDGTVLANDVPVYQVADELNDVIDDKLSGGIAPFGLGTLVVWVENGEVKARKVLCLPN